MKTLSPNLAIAAVAALTEALEREGMSVSPQELLVLLSHAVEEHTRVLPVTIVTPTGKAGSIAEIVSQALERKTGKRVTITQRADPAIIGGAVILYGDKRIDCSMQRTLEDAETILASTL